MNADGSQPDRFLEGADRLVNHIEETIKDESYRDAFQRILAEVGRVATGAGRLKEYAAEREKNLSEVEKAQLRLCKELSTREEAVSKREKKTSELEETQSRMRKELPIREEAVSKREKKASQLAETLCMRHKELSNREEAVSKREKKASQLEETLSIRHKELSDREEDASKREKKLAELEETQFRRETELSNRENDVSKREAQTAAICSLVEQLKAFDIGSLRNDIEVIPARLLEELAMTGPGPTGGSLSVPTPAGSRSSLVGGSQQETRHPGTSVQGCTPPLSQTLPRKRKELHKDQCENPIEGQASGGLNEKKRTMSIKLAGYKVNFTHDGPGDDEIFGMAIAEVDGMLKLKKDNKMLRSHLSGEWNERERHCIPSTCSLPPTEHIGVVCDVNEHAQTSAPSLLSPSSTATAACGCAGMMAEVGQEGLTTGHKTRHHEKNQEQYCSDVCQKAKPNSVAVLGHCEVNELEDRYRGA
ncbi:hypothetical protein DL769_000633 [Monosporascus sp. CRB-8-3]|nr:hypothetical protein DL769_000633 [Monosporascus sp. CRB-8-3]